MKFKMFLIYKGAKMSIRKKFVIFSIILGIVPTCLAVSICIVNFNNKNVEMIKENVTTVAKDQSSKLDEFFKQNITNLNIAANLPITKQLLVTSNNGISDKDLKYNNEMLSQLFESTQKEQFFLDRVLLVNKYGIVIFSSDNRYVGNSSILSDKERETLLKNKIVVTDIIEKKDFNNGVKSAIIARPVFFENKYQGSIFNVINMNYFQNIVDSVGFFKNGKVAIVDRKGEVVSSSSREVKNNINKISSPNSLYSQWKKIDFNKNPNGIIEYNMKGTDKIGYYSRIPNTGWTVLSGVEWSEFKNPINNNIRNLIAILIFIIAIVTIPYIFVIKHFSMPLFKLLESIKRIKKGNYSDRFIYNKDDEFGEIATAFNGLIDKIQENKRHIENKNRNLQSLTSNIPGGVHRNVLENGEFILDFLSGGCLQLLGYERREFNRVFGKKIFDVIYEKDRERVKKEINEQISKHNKFNVEYRLVRKDGSIIWVIDNGQIVKDRNGKVFSYNVVININDAKIAQEKLRLSEERYRIIMSQTEDIIFQWDIKEDTFSHSDKWNRIFNEETDVNNISKKIYKTDVIYKDDLKKLSKILNQIINGEQYEETEIRIKNKNSQYIWYKIRATGIFDENGELFRVIGVIININKEKIEAEKLLYKAQRDSLTSLYNKGITQSIIEEYIENEGEGINGALFIIDVDNFKAINDNLGHLAGDVVLTSISSMLLEVFSENAIVGRMGGDEFMVFLKNVDSQEFLYKKAEDLLKGFRKQHIEQNSKYKISASVGIAMYPKHGVSFKELSINADKAVYIAKKRGKDNYCIFEDG